MESNAKSTASKTHHRSKQPCLSSCCWGQKTSGDQEVESQSDDQNKEVSKSEVASMKEAEGEGEG